MKYNPVSELIYQMFALVFSIIIVHAIYVTVIRPNADALAQQQQQRIAAGEQAEMPKSIHIILKDPEQEICIIMGLWVIAIIGLKIRTAVHERRMLDRPILDIPEGTSVLPEDTRPFVRSIQATLPNEQHYLLPRALLIALQRFGSTRNVQDVANSVKEICEEESNRQDSELSMVRYILWAIPSIGFIGTVRGIGDALSQAQAAVQGDITGVTASLGVAFNSTLVALLISILIMFLTHQLQLMQDRLVLDTRNYCDNHLIRYMQVRQA